MESKMGKTHYKDYLGLEKLLSTQTPYSIKEGKSCHDEMLFIIAHQVYELWFKQILHELYLVKENFQGHYVSEQNLFKSVSALGRIEKIQSVLIDQLDILETMTPMDFLEFRNLLVPASGFQSDQFREIEVLLGLKLTGRPSEHKELISGKLKTKDRERLLTLEEEENLPELLESWLGRLPFTDEEQFSFWKEYKKSVLNMLEQEEDSLKKNHHLTEEAKLGQFKKLNEDYCRFESLFNPKLYEKQKEDGSVSFSQKAYLNALFIFLYRHETVLMLPFQILTSLENIDENFSRWRYRHALMAKRMLGSKMGTGGSTGHRYLNSTVQNNRIFKDLLTIPSYLIPFSELPKIPSTVKEKMNFIRQKTDFKTQEGNKII